MAVDKAGNLYIGSVGLVRKVNGEGVISTYAGNGPILYNGDGEPAKDASIGVAGAKMDGRRGQLVLRRGPAGSDRASGHSRGRGRSGP